MENKLKVLDNGITKFRCGCWVELDLRETFPLVDGDVCNKHNIPDDNQTPNMYKVLWLFLRDWITPFFIFYECDDPRNIKQVDKSMVSKHEVKLSKIDDILNINDFNIDSFK